MKIAAGSDELFTMSENLTPTYEIRLSTQGIINSDIETHVIQPLLDRRYFIEVQQTYSEVNGTRTYTTSWKIDGHLVFQKRANKDVEHVGDVELSCAGNKIHNRNDEFHVTNFNLQVFPTGKIEDIIDMILSLLYVPGVVKPNKWFSN